MVRKCFHLSRKWVEVTFLPLSSWNLKTHSITFKLRNIVQKSRVKACLKCPCMKIRLFFKCFWPIVSYSAGLTTCKDKRVIYCYFIPKVIMKICSLWIFCNYELFLFQKQTDLSNINKKTNHFLILSSKFCSKTKWKFVLI